LKKGAVKKFFCKPPKIVTPPLINPPVPSGFLLAKHPVPAYTVYVHKKEAA
jgi:hypothetical protein